MADRVRDACESYFEAREVDCGDFVRAVAAILGIQLVGLADGIVATLHAGGAWPLRADSVAALQGAAAGKIVLTDLKDAEQT